MNDNSTCENVPCRETGSGSGTGLAVGLPLFFLALIIGAGVFVFMYFKKNKRNMFHLGHRKSQVKDDDYVETPQTEPHQYMTREAPSGQTPVYENLTYRTTNNSSSTDKQRSLGDPDEDLYLECDMPDDAIYSNDPACNLAILSDGHDEDVYIMPDS